LPQGQANETQEAWEAILGGLAALCRGIGAAVAADEAELEASSGLGILGKQQLTQLLKLAGSPGARSTVLGMAAAMPNSAALAQIQSRCASSKRSHLNPMDCCICFIWVNQRTLIAVGYDPKLSSVNVIEIFTFMDRLSIRECLS
jgi:hypothetical protein